MRDEIEIIGRHLPLDCRHYVTITYCMNCDTPIYNERNQIKEYCNNECQEEHELIKLYALEV